MGQYHIIGAMSGTSLDGLDLAYCSFELLNNKWLFKINNAQTIDFPIHLKQKLKHAINMTGLELMQTSNQLGRFMGQSINDFITKNKIEWANIDGIASHGHTVFHQPEKKLTTQIGSGAVISALTQLPVVCDFRTVDVALGGQGAPLVPIGDKLLFSNYDFCINLGGIANISYDDCNKKRIAFDVCPVNIVLNKLAQKMGYSYDENGALSKSGNINAALLEQLNGLDYYKKVAPKSLGLEYIEASVFPILEPFEMTTEDKLSTFVTHIAVQIAAAIPTKNKKVLFTGGGTFNSFLVERIKAKTNNNVTVPSPQIVAFKEALIFAFLGVLRLRNETNCLNSVTGAVADNVGGCVYRAF